jgi:ribosomal protein L29
MKAVDFRKNADQELRDLRVSTRKEIFDIQMKKGRGDTSEQPLRVRGLRRDVARIETVMRERGIC